MQVLILGCGDIGARVGASLIERDWRVAAVRRNPNQLPSTFEGYALDLTDPDSFAAMAPIQPDYVVVTPTPQSYDPAGYHAGFAGVAQSLAAQGWLRQCRRSDRHTTPRKPYYHS